MRTLQGNIESRTQIEVSNAQESSKQNFKLKQTLTHCELQKNDIDITLKI